MNGHWLPFDFSSHHATEVLRIAFYSRSALQQSVLYGVTFTSTVLQFCGGPPLPGDKNLRQRIGKIQQKIVLLFLLPVHHVRGSRSPAQRGVYSKRAALFGWPPQTLGSRWAVSTPGRTSVLLQTP